MKRLITLCICLLVAVPVAGCGDDEPDAPADGTSLPVEISEFWRTDFGGIVLEYKNIADADKGPTVTNAGASVTVIWRNAVYKDCEEPTGFRVQRSGTALTLTLESVNSPHLCDNKDVIGDAKSTFTLEPAGDYTITVDIAVTPTNVGAHNALKQDFPITVP